jgi:small subunit ribosomal protein S16
MLMIRLQRVGRKHEPTFRVVLTDSHNSTKSGRMIEVLGSHDPRHKDMTKLDTDRIKHHISKGAQLSDTMHNMLVEKKVITGKKINVLPKKTVEKKEEAPVAAAPVAEAAPAPAEPAAETPAA